jgi:phage gp46-like protein
MGSKIWLLSRSKALPSIAPTAEGYAQAALAWLVSDGIAASVSTAASWVSSTALQLTITIVRGSGKPIVITFANLWDFL